MKRFFQRIHEKAKDVSRAPVLIVALGDSVTQGVMEQNILDAEGVYHRLLQRQLETFFPTTTFSTINAGVSGDTAPKALKRLERDVLRHDPDLVLISVGGNDAGGGVEGLPAFTETLLQIISRIQQKTSADILLLTPTFAARRKNVRIHPDHESIAEGIIDRQVKGIVGQYAKAIREVAAASKVDIADIYNEWSRLAEDGLDTDTWLINGLNHPDRRGHKLAASLLFQKLLAAMTDSETPAVAVRSSS
jgi:acyl-CoA thioesterase I